MMSDSGPLPGVDVATAGTKRVFARPEGGIHAVYALETTAT